MVDVVGVGVEVVVVLVVELRLVIRDDDDDVQYADNMDLEVENVDVLIFCIVYC